MKYLFVRLFGGVTGLLFLLALVVGVGLHLYTQRVVGQLRDEAREIVQFYAQTVGEVAAAESEDLTFLFDQIIRRIRFPLIQTDADHNPVSWKEIGVDPEDRSPEALDRVRGMLRRMDREIDPVAIKYEETPLGYLYYGDSRLIWQLRWLPYVQMAIIGLFILIGLAGSAQSRQSEMRSIWVGMAKETAHQLGTPISSLMGWVELLRSGNIPEGARVYADMEKDLARLVRVTGRFSQIGSRPDLQATDLAPVIREVCEYIRRRTPRSGRRVEIEERYESVPRIRLNGDLFQWAVENVMKNALDGMDKEDGRIIVRAGAEKNGKKVFLEIEDNGRGIEETLKKKIFKPGYSTKKRGWGLGLSLARRIVQEYHGGRLYVKETRPGQGMTLRFELKS
ncbi:MAG TPA: HAMP domain-containing histidine kinase [bacterium]|nr:HAMP domain-containing histidine kinase [bacterium]